MAVDSRVRATETSEGHERSDERAEGLTERLATWVVTFVASLAASLSLLGGAWALGLVG
jgi:hypothetical protein